jgi:hypothetical protein
MKIATCHPERPHLAKGMCSQCYWKARYADPETGKAHSRVPEGLL